MSMKLTPIARWRTRTSLGCGGGSSSVDHSSTSGPPWRRTRRAGTRRSSDMEGLPQDRVRGPTVTLRRQRVGGERQRFDRSAADQMLLDDALEVGVGLRAIPGALRVDEHDRPARADAQAIDLAAQHPAVDVGELEREQALLEVIPRGERLFLRRTAAADAQEN